MLAKRLVSFTVPVLLCLVAAPVSADDDLRSDIAAHYDAVLEDLFVHFHENPELSFRESDTAARLAEELRKLGLEVTEGVGRTGLVSVIENGQGPTVLVRADMDGLPVKEQSGVSYAADVTQENIHGVERPVMHACGHDVHITSLVGTAKALLDRKDQWRGTVVLIGQPAEERIMGARAMLEDGLYERFPKPDYALAFHVSSQLESGKIRIEPGLNFSSSDSVDIVVHGVGSHGASPHKGIDPVLVASNIVVDLQSLVSRSISPLEPSVVTVGSIHGGSKHNIIGDRVKLQLTVRADTQGTRKDLIAGIRRIAEGVGRTFGLPEDKLPEVKRLAERTPPTYNDPEATATVREGIATAMGEDRIVTKPRSGMGAEDFAYFVQPDTGVKGVYFRVGGTPAGEVEDAPAHHSPKFKIEPEPSVKAGVRAMTVGAMSLLAEP